jgi:IS4 transposase
VRLNLCRTVHDKGSIQNSRRFKSKYIKVDALYKGTPVRLFYVRYKGAGTWKLLLTTDLSLSFTKAMELYQIRWTIEVLFKECKQYLRLGQGQNTDFDGQIADITITLLSL